VSEPRDGVRSPVRKRVLNLTEIRNPPGQSSLASRIGTYQSFLKRMLDRLSVQEQPAAAQKDGRIPLRHWNTNAADNWLNALLQSWAAAGDVLTFYTERIVNEGYLRTAREDVSVRELVRSLHYRPQPGTAGRVSLAFTVSSAPTAPAQVTVPRGTRLQSVPVRQELPQTFETLDDLTARAEWNALKPGTESFSPETSLTGAATRIWVLGAPAGLEPGVPLLLAGSDPDGIPVQLLRFIESVEVQAVPGVGTVTAINWQGALDPSQPDGVVIARGLTLSVFRRRCQLFGYDAPAWKDLPPEAARQYSAIGGGVLLSSDAGKAWSPVNGGLPAKPLRFLACGADSAFYACGAAGIFRSLDTGASWQPIQEGLLAPDVQSMLLDPRGTLWIGTSDGKVYRSYDRGGTWEGVSGGALKRKGNRWKAVSTQLPPGPVSSLAAVVEGGGLTVWAGTNQGVFRSEDASNGWEPVNSGLPGLSKDTGFADLPVYAVAPGPSAGLLFAGTAQGIFRSGDRGEAWGAINRGLPDTAEDTGLSKTAVRALLVNTQARTATTYLFAGTNKGVYRSTDLGRSWRAANLGLPGTDPRSGASTTSVSCLTALADTRTLVTYLFAGTPAGLFVSGDFGETWGPSGTRSTAVPIAALAAGGNGAVLAGTPWGGLLEDDWPGFYIDGPQVDLATTEPSILPETWAVLYQTREDEGPLQGIYRILDVRTVRRQDFALDSLVTRLEVDTGEDLAIFDLRTAAVFARSEALEPYLEKILRFGPLDPERVRLDRRLEEPFPLARPVVVTGKPIRASFAGAPPTLIPLEEGRAAQTLPGGDEVQVLAPPVTDGGQVTLLVRDPLSGAQGQVTVPEGAVVWQPAAAADGVIGQERDAETAAYGSEGGVGTPPTVLLFDPPLTCCLDPRTVTIYANVAEASQGGTVPQEVLGSGDASVPNQRFSLRLPLTYLRVGADIQAALDIRINGVLWTEVPSLYETGPRDQVYMVSTGAQGLPVVLFGDGVHGARLPTGRENVVAVYRSGMWTDPVDPGHISIVQTRPLGVQAVSNPLTCPPGTPVETLDQTRTRAPRSVRFLDRIVSLSDYEDFVSVYPGVYRALVQTFWSGGRHLIYITLAPVDGRVLDLGDPLITDLARAIEQVRDTPRPLEIANYQPVTFQLSARVLVDRRYRLPATEAAIRSALSETYAFDRSRFGQILTSAEATTLIQDVAGVVSVELDAFHATGTPAKVETQLRAKRAAETPSGLRPAELLVIDPSGIELGLGVAP
jgi:hypothetical protein